jgi:serine/threonine-protein kinase RsbW
MLKRLKIESSQKSLRVVEKLIDDITSELGISQDCYGKILVSTMEGVNNAIIHGNRLIPEKLVDIQFQCSGTELKVKIRDEGQGFRPGEVPDPTLLKNREELNGRGVFLMSHLADEIKFTKKGNSVTMIFKNILD